MKLRKKLYSGGGGGGGWGGGGGVRKLICQLLPWIQLAMLSGIVQDGGRFKLF